ncbi:MAG TPA: class I SAM-dependent methyltransferase [Streptosporangiaceae bacterium]|nr:class I SAM-dependent methyltransferase [Streptosporangiaceae bacterium]
MLDIGAGDGALARPLAERVDRVDAVDVSAAMLAAGARQPGGDRPNLR